jgi:hypothetical protein
MKSKMKVGDGLLKFIRTERHEKLSVISMEMVIEGVRRDEMTEGDGVKNWTKTIPCTVQIDAKLTFGAYKKHLLCCDLTEYIAQFDWQFYIQFVFYSCNYYVLCIFIFLSLSVSDQYAFLCIF